VQGLSRVASGETVGVSGVGDGGMEGGQGGEEGGSFVAAWERDGWMFEQWRCAPGPPLVLPVHEHDCYQLSLTLDLPAEHRYRRVLHRSPPGATSLIHPGEAHETRQPVVASAAHRYLVAYVPVATVEAVAAAMTGKRVREPFFDVTVVDDQAFRSSVISLVTGQRHGLAVDALPLADDHRRLATVVAALVRGAGVDPEPDRAPPAATNRAAVAVDYLREHYAGPVRIAELVGVSGLSERHLYRSFAALTGVTPHRYQLNLRVEHAKRLLASGWTATAASAAAGFADQSHLSRQFRRLLGLSPGRYGVRWRDPLGSRSAAPMAGTFKR
jgi:AraC-like DNA-binding protein